jgi:HEAT repeat protein
MMRALLLLLVFCAGPVLAQDKPTFDLPKGEPAKEKPVAQEQQAALERAILRLSGWPSERSRRAAEQLIVQREKSLPMVLAVLVSEDRRHAPLKPGAAYVVGRIGEKSQFLTLLLVAAEKPQRRHASVFLEAAWRLNPDAAVAEAFRFFRLSETTLRHEATRFVRDRISKSHLPRVLDLLDRENTERPFTREIGLQLLDRLVQTGEVEWSSAGPRFYSTLGDESPSVCARAMRILASRKEQDNINALNELITKKYSYWRQRSYAAMALSVMSSAYKVQPLTTESIDMLKGRRGLGHPKEMLPQAAAALALGEAALRTGDEELVRLLDGRIPIVLIESVGAGNRHYRDFASVMPLAYTMLRKITGQVFPDHAPRWAQWWRDNGKHFRARRELLEVREEDIPATLIDLKKPKSMGGAALRLATVGDKRPMFLHGRAYALPPDEMERIVDALRESGFFSAAAPDPNKIGDDVAMITVRVGDLARTVAYSDATDGMRDRILKGAERLAGDYGWQHWWDRKGQPSWALFFGENRKWFHENPGAEARADRLREMISASLDDLLLQEERTRAARYVAALPGAGGALNKAQVQRFLKAVQLEREPNEFVAAALELLVPSAGEAAATGLIETLAAQPDPRALGLLTHLCTRLPSAMLGGLSTDERWKVRYAAVGALAAGDESDKARELLAARLSDNEETVAAEAAAALAKHGDRTVIPTLDKLAMSRSSEIRATAARSYGVLGGDSALGNLRPLLYRDPELRVRRQAIEGLVQGKDPGAPILLLGVFERESDPKVRAAASNGLVSLETPELVNKLVARLEHTPSASPERVAIVNVLARVRSDVPVPLLQAVLQGDDLLSADAAALGLARRWNDSAIGQLIRMAEQNRNPRAAIRHLQILSSWSNPAESYAEQAANYKGWYKVNSTGRPLTWFRDMLTTRGYDTSVLNDVVRNTAGTQVPVVDDGCVPLLLRALRDDEWYLRRNASFLLNERIGPGAPKPITYSTRKAEAEATIAEYNAWWAMEQKRKSAEKRG